MISNEFVYLTIPNKYLPVYKHILIMLADYGEDMLKDCKAACKTKNVCIINYFNMFNAALAAYELGNTKLADVLIKYIKVELNITLDEVIDDSQNSEPSGGTGDDENENPNTNPVTTRYWYVGQITKTRPEFAELTTQQLLDASTAFSTSTKTASILLNKSCWFVMVPVSSDISTAYYIDSGVLTEYSEQEIKNNFGGLVTHENVTIDGTIYKVYVNRSIGFIDSNLQAWFVIK